MELITSSGCGKARLCMFPLWRMKLQEKEEEKDIGKLFKNSPKKKGVY